MENKILDKYKCRNCGETFLIDAGVFDEYEELLWAHIQMEHPEIFDKYEDFETPFMLEECYKVIK